MLKVLPSLCDLGAKSHEGTEAGSRQSVEWCYLLLLYGPFMLLPFSAPLLLFLCPHRSLSLLLLCGGDVHLRGMCCDYYVLKCLQVFEGHKSTLRTWTIPQALRGGASGLDLLVLLLIVYGHVWGSFLSWGESQGLRELAQVGLGPGYEHHRRQDKGTAKKSV
jgi:hypothetical protein